MGDLDWSTFEKRISIDAPITTLFKYWTSQENIEKWFLSQAQFYDKDGDERARDSQIQKGDTYVWMWHGSDTIEKGEVLNTNSKDYLEFTFLGCVVSVNILLENEAHVVEIIQKEIPLDEQSKMNLFVGCSRGWTFYAANLKSILEGGIDLRNKNISLTNVINT